MINFKVLIMANRKTKIDYGALVDFLKKLNALSMSLNEDYNALRKKLDNLVPAEWDDKKAIEFSKLLADKGNDLKKLSDKASEYRVLIIKKWETPLKEYMNSKLPK
jgi:hypothetical protein